MSNLKQLGVAFISYSHDNAETVPYDKKAGNSGWVGLMKSYGVTDRVLHCPMCDENNKHSLGGMRKNWRVGPMPKPDLKVGTVVAKDGPVAKTSADQSQWARHPNYWRFLVGGHGRNNKAVFTLNHRVPGCHGYKCGAPGTHNQHWSLKPYKSPCPPWQMITPPPWNLGSKSVGGSTIVLLMCENVAPSGFALKISDAKTGQRLDSLHGVTVDDWELFEWSGPLAKALGGKGSLLSPSYPYHKKAIGFDQANPQGRQPLQQGKYYPNPPNGNGPVNYIYMWTTIRSSIDQNLNIAVTGDEAYSVFLLDSTNYPCTPGSPCDPGEPTTSSYGINGYAQSRHHHAEYEPEKFLEVPELLKSSTPLFSESNAAWVMPLPNSDIPPATLDGGYGGIQRVILNRHDKHVNMVYGDGHAAPVKLRDLYTQEWYPGCKMMPGLTVPQLPKN